MPGSLPKPQPSGRNWRRPLLLSSVFALPAWLLSLALHLLVGIGLALTVLLVPPGAADEPVREGGIVLKVRDAQGERFVGRAPAAEAQGETNATNDVETLAQRLNTPPQLSAAGLPSLPNARGVGAPAGEGIASVGAMTGGGAPRRGGGGQKLGYTRTGIFGVEGEGNKFVYVFDRSASMSEPDERPLRAAKQELVESLADLGDIQQFHIVFYNEAPRVFDPGGVPGRLVFGSDANKEAAQRFIASIKADGGTEHERALRVALAMQPDVLFLLTDGDAKDDLSPEQIVDLTRRNSGRTSINVVQFTTDPQQENGLARLAADNGGQHVFVNLAELR